MAWDFDGRDQESIHDMATIFVVKSLWVVCLIRVTVVGDVNLVGVEARMCRPRSVLAVCIVLNVD